MAEVLERKSKFAPLPPVRRKLAEHGRQTHLITVESAEYPEDFLKPEFWALVAKDMQLGDHVEIRDDSMSFWGEYIVLGCDATWAQLHQLRQAQLVPAEQRLISPDFLVAFKGPHRKWCIVRISDGAIVHEGEQHRGAANLWLEGYAKTIGASVSRPIAQAEPAPAAKAKKAA